MKKRILFVIQGDYSKEFLESMGYKPFVPEPVKTCKDPVMPLTCIIKNLYPEAKGLYANKDLPNQKISL